MILISFLLFVDFMFFVMISLKMQVVFEFFNIEVFSINNGLLEFNLLIFVLKQFLCDGLGGFKGLEMILILSGCLDGNFLFVFLYS